jgi:hypothetical protein
MHFLKIQTNQAFSTQTANYFFLVHYNALKKFILSTKSAKRLKFSVPLICENIHIFCPQDGEIKN